MRKRLLTKKYLRDVNEYSIRIFKEGDTYICIKEIIDTKNPFYISKGLCLVNNGYHIIEILPLNEKFCVRTFLNEKNEFLQKYIDISLGNGIDKETNIPYYDDAFLDIIIDDNEVYVDDKEELEEAYKNKEISEDIYNEANSICDRLLNELKTNEYIIKDVKEYL